MADKTAALIGAAGLVIGAVTGGFLASYVKGSNGQDEFKGTASRSSSVEKPSTGAGQESTETLEALSKKNKELEQATGQIARITDELEKEKVKAKNISFELDDVRKKFAQINEEAKKEREKHVHTKEELQKSTIDLAKAHTAVKDLQKERQNQTTEIVHLKNQLEAMQKKTEGLRHINEDEQRKISQTEAELIKFKKSYEEFETYKKQQTTVEAGLKSDLEGKVIRILEIEKELNEAKEITNKLRSQLQSQSDIHKNKLDALEEKVATLEKENATEKELTKQVNEQMFLVEKNYKQQLEEAKREAESQANELRALLKKKEEELQQANSELAELQKE